MPRISVIVPVYKVEKYIHRCVDSILAQTFTDFELILVDDGSPDNCPAICDEYAAKDSRIHVIHQENGGLSAARNAGIDWVFSNSDSEWISFVDSDDWIRERYLELLYDAVVENGVSISVCSFKESTAQPESYDIFSEVDFEILTPEDLYCNPKMNAIPTCGKLYFKKLWGDVRFPVGKIHEDRFTTHKLLFKTTKVAWTSEELYTYTINPDSITHSSWSPKRLDDIEAVEEQLRFFKNCGYERSYIRTRVSELYITCKMLEEINKSNECACVYKSYSRSVRKKLRRDLRNAKKELQISIKSGAYYYESAYPKLMALYWYWQVLLKKLHITWFPKSRRK